MHTDARQVDHDVTQSSAAGQCIICLVKPDMAHSAVCNIVQLMRYLTLIVYWGSHVADRVATLSHNRYGATLAMSASTAACTHANQCCIATWRPIRQLERCLSIAEMQNPFLA